LNIILQGQAEQELGHLIVLRKLDQNNVLDDLAESHALKEEHEKLQKNFTAVRIIVSPDIISVLIQSLSTG
jgi:hypothetical protein